MSRDRYDGGDHKQDAAEMSHITLGTQRITERADPPQKSDCAEPKADKGAFIRNLRIGGSPRGCPPEGD
jgi:hypothetical protein